MAPYPILRMIWSNFALKICLSGPFNPFIAGLADTWHHSKDPMQTLSEFIRLNQIWMLYDLVPKGAHREGAVALLKINIDQNILSVECVEEWLNI